MMFAINIHLEMGCTFSSEETNIYVL